MSGGKRRSNVTAHPRTDVGEKRTLQRLVGSDVVTLVVAVMVSGLKPVAVAPACVVVVAKPEYLGAVALEQVVAWSGTMA